MPARFYRPFTKEFGSRPSIVYPARDSEHPLGRAYSPADMSGIVAHLDELYATHPDRLERGTHHIVFAWALGTVAMTDIWMHDENPTSHTSGPLVNVETFDGLEPSVDVGVASGDTLIVLGREEELRRHTGELTVYLSREIIMPDLPDGFCLDRPFGNA